MSETEDQPFIHPAVLERITAEQNAGRARLEEFALIDPPLAVSEAAEVDTGEAQGVEPEDDAQIQLPLTDAQIAAAEAEFRRATAPATGFLAPLPPEDPPAAPVEAEEAPAPEPVEEPAEEVAEEALADEASVDDGLDDGLADLI